MLFVNAKLYKIPLKCSHRVRHLTKFNTSYDAVCNNRKRENMASVQILYEDVISIIVCHLFYILSIY